MRLLLHVCCAAMVAGFTPAFAQNAIEPKPPAAGAEAPPLVAETELPPNRIGRVSLVSGNLDLRSLDGGHWAGAELNRPVFTGEALRTDPRSHGEIEIGANTIDLSNGTEVEITSLRDRVTQITLSHGRIGVRLRQAGEDEAVEIYFSQGGIWLLAPGDYDIDTGIGDQPPRITAFEGKAQFVGSNSDIPVEANQRVLLTGSDGTAATVERATSDAFVEWCREREYDETRLAAPYYISPYMSGFAALDAAGIWKIHSQYGPVWFPTTPEEWAPYRFGRWSWIAPWGWTWIDDQPWGFAPSHYGRWALIEDHWAWVPGSFVERPLYAPAVVAFLGTRGVGLSSEEGAAVAWFPLAPGEAYWPSHTRDVDYVRDLNRGNVQDAGAIQMPANGEPPLEIFDEPFANRQYATVVPRTVFTNERPIASARMTLPEQRLQNAPVLMASPQLAPASAQQIVRATTPTVAAPSIRTAVREAKSGGKLIRTAAVPPHGLAQPIVIRGVHLRAPSYAGSPHGRQMIVLHVAQPHSGAGRRAHG